MKALSPETADLIKRPEFQLQFLAPKYWGLWLMFAVSWSVSQLPWRVQFVAGRFLGRCFVWVGSRRCVIAKRNIELCLPELTSTEKDELLLKSFESLGIGILEVGVAWWSSREKLEHSWVLSGREHIDECQSGVILMGIHQTCIEMAGAAASLAISADVTYRRHRNPFYEYMQRSRRLRFNEAGRRLVERKDVRAFIRGLKAGRVMWYLPDQDYGPKQSVFVPFMGINAATITGTAKLCRMTGAKVVPISAYRNYKTGKYHITFHKPWDDFPAGVDEADALRVNQHVESILRQRPEDYFWVHRRFKTRPPGESPLY